jgi:uncharacterized delta-60 repeat protein
MDVTLLGQLGQKAGQPGHHPTGDAKGSGGGSGHSPGAGTSSGPILSAATTVNSSVITSLSAGADQANAMLIQGDGKIVAAGFANGGILTGQFAAVRYNSDLTPDTSFGTSGIQTTTISGHGDEANAMAFQSDGKIVLAGYANSIQVQGVYYANFAVARYNMNGSLDTSFNGKGFTTTDVFPGTKKVAHASVARAVAIDSSGRIVVAGGTNGEFAVARYTSSGALDTTFNSTGSLPGTIITPISGGNATAYSAIVQADGKILVGGNAGGLFTFVRYKADGTLDSTFGSGGIVVEPSMGAPNSNAFRAMTLDANGNIVAVGNGAIAGVGNFSLIARFTPAGALDTTFNGSGYAITDLSSMNSGNSQGTAVNIQSDRKLLLSGWAVLADNGAYNQNFAAARYNTNGTLDTTFNSTGILTYVFASSPFSTDVAYGAGLASNGNLIMAGFTSAPPAGQPASGNNFALLSVTP